VTLLEFSQEPWYFVNSPRVSIGSACSASLTTGHDRPAGLTQSRVQHSPSERTLVETLLPAPDIFCEFSWRKSGNPLLLKAPPGSWSQMRAGLLFFFLEKESMKTHEKN